VAWALRAWAEAQTHVALPPPPDPATGWDTFAASRLEWASSAAVPVDLLFVTYARWCTAHGEPVLAEDKVLAWLEQHGTTVRIRALSQVTAVEGVRVED
jgi:hypothetical protein